MYICTYRFLVDCVKDSHSARPRHVLWGWELGHDRSSHSWGSTCWDPGAPQILVKFRYKLMGIYDTYDTVDGRHINAPVGSSETDCFSNGSIRWDKHGYCCRISQPSTIWRCDSHSWPIPKGRIQMAKELWDEWQEDNPVLNMLDRLEPCLGWTCLFWDLRHDFWMDACSCVTFGKRHLTNSIDVWATETYVAERKYCHENPSIMNYYELCKDQTQFSQDISHRVWFPIDFPRCRPFVSPYGVLGVAALVVSYGEWPRVVSGLPAVKISSCWTAELIKWCSTGEFMGNIVKYWGTPEIHGISWPNTLLGRPLRARYRGDWLMTGWWDEMNALKSSPTNTGIIGGSFHNNSGVSFHHFLVYL